MNGPHRALLTLLERYGVAIALSVLALLAWHFGINRIGLSPFFLYLVTVMVASWFGGFGPGLLAMVMAVLGSNAAYDFPGTYLLHMSHVLIQLAIYLFVALAMILLNTERLQLLEEERSMRRRLERITAEQAAMLGQMTEAVLISDTTGRITYANQAAQQLFGLPDVSMQTLEKLATWVRMKAIDGNPVPIFEQTLTRAARGEQIHGVERVVERRDGTRLVVQTHAAQVRGPDGTVLGAIATTRDVTLQRELEREKEVLLSAVIHDLKSPLATIKGVAQLLQRRIRKVPEASNVAETMCQGLEDINNKVSEMVRLIDDFMEIAQDDNATVSLNRSSVDLVEMVSDLVSTMQKAADRRVFKVESSIPRSTGNWDATLLRRAIDNLLSNAVKYSPDGGKITVRIDCEHDGSERYAVLSIEDEGIGIPPEEQAQVFDRFFRARNAIGRVPGTGIGLASVKQIIERHGGTISVSSTEGQGTVMTVRMPLDHQSGS